MADTHTDARTADSYTVGPLEILPAEHLARADGRALMLSTRELRLLTELARHEDRIVDRERLFADVWGHAMRPRDRSVDVYVRKLRVKLALALPGWRFIHTHFGFGYRLAAEPEPEPEPEPARGANAIATSDSQLVHTKSPPGGQTPRTDHE